MGTRTDLYLRRRVGGSDLALYAEGAIGEDHTRLPFTGKIRKSRKAHDADCGHKIRIGDQYFDVRSSFLAGVAVRYCKKCLDAAENTPWDFEDDLEEHEQVMDSLTESDWGF